MSKSLVSDYEKQAKRIDLEFECSHGDSIENLLLRIKQVQEAHPGQRLFYRIEDEYTIQFYRLESEEERIARIRKLKAERKAKQTNAEYQQYLKLKEQFG